MRERSWPGLTRRGATWDRPTTWYRSVVNRGQVAVALAALGLACSRGEDDGRPGAATFADASASNGDDGATGTGSADGSPETGTEPDDDDNDDDADTTAGEDSTTSGGVVDEPPDLSDGQWVFENISMTVGISLHNQRTTLDDGREIVAWAQADTRNISNVNIMTADGPMEWAVKSVTAIPDAQNTYPSLAGGNRALLAWAGQSSQGEDYDIYLVRSQGSSWSGPENVSDMFEDAMTPMTDTEPVILRRTDGGVAIVYLATLPPAGKFDPPNTPEIFVSKFFEDNAPSSRQALNPAGATCNSLAGATAPSDVFHVVFACSDGGESVLIHATDRSGDWDTDELNGVTSGILSPGMAPGTDGSHLVWIQDVPCGDENCSEVFHMATGTEEVFGSPMQVTDTANLNERMPAVGVDPWGRVFVAAQARVDNTARLYLSFAEDGETFTDAERISPDSVDDYQSPGGFAFDDEGYPSFVAQVVEDGSDPLNIEIHLARFVPN